MGNDMLGELMTKLREAGVDTAQVGVSYYGPGEPCPAALVLRRLLSDTLEERDQAVAQLGESRKRIGELERALERKPDVPAPIFLPPGSSGYYCGLGSAVTIEWAPAK